MNNEQQEIWYQDIMDLGFETEVIHDPVFFSKHGFPYTIVSKQLTKHISAIWTMTDRKAYLLRCDKDMNILARLNIDNLEELKTIIEFFTKNKKEA